MVVFVGLGGLCCDVGVVSMEDEEVDIVGLQCVYYFICVGGGSGRYCVVGGYVEGCLVDVWFGWDYVYVFVQCVYVDWMVVEFVFVFFVDVDQCVFLLVDVVVVWIVFMCVCVVVFFVLFG